MTDDSQLLRRYVEEGSEEAFAELVRRHVGWVFHAGLRRTGGRRDLAQDVAQHVFTVLARNASALCDHQVLAGWLHTTTRFAASHALRAEARRRKHETAAHLMTEMEHRAREANWDELRPALDEVIDRLPAAEREPLLLRFFEQLGFAEIGAALGVSEDGARKRVDRALEKLRTRLARRGVTSTATALGTLLLAQANAAVTAEMQATVTSAALAGAALPATSAVGVVSFMTATKTAFSGAALLGLTGIVALSSFGLAFHEVRAAQAANRVLADATTRYGLERARLNEPGSNRTAGDPSTPANQPVAVAETAGGNPPGEKPPASPTRDPRADGRAFLAVIPQARAVIAEIARREFAQRYALFYRQAGLTSAQIDRFEARTLERAFDFIEVTPADVHLDTQTVGQALPPVDELREIFGDEGFRQWQDFQRAQFADYLAKTLAAEIKNGAVPLTAEQIAELAQIVTRSSPEFHAGAAHIDPATLDWTTALTQAARIMTPEQWQQTQPWLLGKSVEARLKALQGTTP